MRVLLFIDIYRAAFEDANVESAAWDDTTLYLYFCIISLVFIGGWVIEKNTKRLDGLSKGAYIWIAFTGILLTSILGLRGVNIGIDTGAYRESFENALNRDAFSDSTIEPGWQSLAKIMRFIFPSSELFVFIISAITVYLIIKTIWKYRISINIFLALLFYVGLYYFQAMNLMRIYLAMSILIFFFHYLLEGKYVKYIIIVLMTTMLHLSSIVMLLPVAMLWLYQRSKLLAVFAFFLLMVSLINFSIVFGDYIAIARYADYASGNESSRQVGVMLFFDYLPCFAMIIYAIKNKLSNQWTDLLVSFTLVAFLMRFIAYFITIAGRLGIHFAILYLLLLPYFVNHMRLHHRRLYPITLFLLILFVIIRVHFYFKGYLAIDGIMPYNFIWNDL